MGGLKLQGEVIATGLKFPEGPVALPDGSVLVVEIANLSDKTAARASASARQRPPAASCNASIACTRKA